MVLRSTSFNTLRNRFTFSGPGLVKPNMSVLSLVLNHESV